MTMEFTGERFIPGEGGAAIAYEHLHRYLFALNWAEGARVVDVASGEGYGAALLAGTARFVCGIELDPLALASARRSYNLPGLAFVRADAARLPIADCSADLAVAFEVLEHLPAESQQVLVRELARIVAPEGVVLVSTPDKAAYSDARNYVNPFHTREFYRAEFQALMTAHFGFVRLYSQQVRAGSLIMSEEAPRGASGEVWTRPLPDASRSLSPCFYLVALAARAALPERAPPASSCLDPTDFLLDETLAEQARLDGEIRRLGSWGNSLEQAIAGRDATIRGLQQEIQDEVRRRDEALARLQAEFEDRSRWARDLEERVVDRDRRLGEAMEELQQTIRDLRRIEQRFAALGRRLPYRILRRLGFLPD